MFERVGRRDGEPDELNPEQLAAIAALEECILNEHNVPHIPQTVLETLKRMPDRSQRIDLSRNLGTALALWLHDDGKRGSDSRKTLFLQFWLRVHAG
jgi:hypothetical protein